MEAYIGAMPCSPRIRVAVLSSLCALLLGPLIRAQSQREKPQPCSPPCVSRDEFKEMTGEKVYPKIIVDDVKFDGPVSLPNSSDKPEIVSELKKHMLDDAQNGLEAVLEVRIRGAWQEQGFFKVLIDGHSRVVSSDSIYEHVIVTIRVDPGLQYGLGDVRFRSSDPDDRETLAFPREELRKAVLLQEGDIFNVTKIRESLDALHKLYVSHGYIDFVAEPGTEVEEDARRISLVLELSEGRQFRVRKIEVLDLEPGKAAMLTPKLKPGDVFQNEPLEEFIRANIPELTDVALSEVLVLRKNEKDASVDILFDFRVWERQRQF
jgi:hypothetical protein